MGKKRKEPSPAKIAEVDGRRIVVADLYLRGVRASEIAKQLTCSTSVVADDLRVLRCEWAKNATQKIDQRIAQELAKLDALEAKYHAAWERSCQDAVTTRAHRIPVPDNPSETITTQEVVTTVGQAGDPRFLDGVERCIDRRCRILGVIKRERGGENDGRGGNHTDVSVVVYLPDNGRGHARAIDHVNNPASQHVFTTTPAVAGGNQIAHHGDGEPTS